MHFSFRYILSILYYFLLKNAQGRQPRIIGGNQTQSGELTYVVGGYSQSGSSFMGSIIDDRFVISAAHSFFNSNEKKFYETLFKFMAGTNDFSDLESKENRIERDVEKVYIPVGFEVDRNFDIAVVKLRQSLDLEKNNIEKLVLPPKGEDYIGKQALAAGAGTDTVTIRVLQDGTNIYERDLDYKLKSINTKVISNEECGQIYENPSISKTNLLLCARSLSNAYFHGPCLGDSGGPLVFQPNVLIGVITTGESQCNGNHAPAIYTRVTSFIDFIERAMEDNVTDDMLSESYTGSF